MRLDIGDGLELAYSIYGQAAGRSNMALLLHGFTGCGASWYEIVRDLGDSFTLILPDLLGHGRSSTPTNTARYTMEAAAAQLSLLLDQAATEPVHLMGYSMGGRLALYFALSYPERVRSLVLESASPGLETAAERSARCTSDEALAETILLEGIEAFVNRWEALPLFASQARLPSKVRYQQRQLRLLNDPIGLAGSLRGMGTGAQPSLWDRLGTLLCPVLLITGERDEKFLGINQQMVERIPHATLAVIPGAGHTTHLEQPGLFSQQVREFWEQW